MTIKVNVKEIVEMIYGSGNLSGSAMLLKRVEQGALIHREHQAGYTSEDRSEVAVDYEDNIDGHTIIITGRIDGVIKDDDGIIIEEIKSTAANLDNIDENTTPAHFAQAKFYAFFYCKKYKIDIVKVRLVYIHIKSKEQKELLFTFSVEELSAFYLETMKIYIYWMKLVADYEAKRSRAIQGLEFPFEDYRSGQKELMAGVYKNITNGSILYALAPTGIGKTIATLFPALKAMNQKYQKLFYLTAKNLGKKTALDTAGLLMNNGLEAKVIEITAKDSVCFQNIRDCDPEKCPFARDYYNRLFEGLQDIYDSEDMFDKETISLYAKKHTLCPFEFSLDLSYYADIIICDYNYVFCPLTHLYRYFSVDSKYLPIILVDEAHNLPSRSRDMYSGRVSKHELQLLSSIIPHKEKKIHEKIKKILEETEAYESITAGEDYLVSGFNKDYISLAQTVLDSINEYIDENKNIENRKEIMTVLQELIRFVVVSDFFNDEFVFSLAKEKNDFQVKIDCLDAASFLLTTIKEHTLSSTFFSATLYPLEYYMKTLSEGEGDSIIIDSPFDESRLKLLFYDNVSTKYRNREQSIEAIIDAIRVLGNSKVGNYIIFFPSYSYLQMVYKELMHRVVDFSFIVQEANFTAKERENIIELFKTNDKTQIGLFVMGGMFSEGIDYIGDMLKGVIIVGVGLPHYGGYNNVAKDYYDRKLQNGFDFAYTYPGFTKVVQAVGRVIRGEHDFGVAIFIDDRFTSIKYRRLFPKEWSRFCRVRDSFELSEELDNFWKLF